MKSDSVIELTDLIVTPLDLGRVQREIFDIDQKLNANKGNLPYIGNELNSIVKAANVNLLQADDRDRVIKQLAFVRRTAPSIQVSFASQPSKLAIRPIVRWFRQNGHPNTLVNINIQPELGGGCVVRTSSREFDFSLQKIFKQNQNLLASKLV